ncbi:MAG: hypothetical protein FWD68_11865 [Alphaproteobacteria bacterium]|nr:hypothetical protein [Alphaproteobacteria bacterium]
MTSNIERFSSQPMGELIDYLSIQGDGLYIVGLDNHVGFISKSGGRYRFVHSSYYHPETGVMTEPLAGRNPLHDSMYLVVGRIMGAEMARNWSGISMRALPHRVLQS